MFYLVTIAPVRNVIVRLIYGFGFFIWLLILLKSIQSKGKFSDKISSFPTIHHFVHEFAVKPFTPCCFKGLLTQIHINVSRFRINIIKWPFLIISNNHIKDLIITNDLSVAFIRDSYAAQHVHWQTLSLVFYIAKLVLNAPNIAFIEVKT